MSTIGTTYPSSTSTSATNSSGTSTSSQSDLSSSANSLANQQTFLQLLVAQLQHQDPTQPVQGTEFVTQLATFSNVEQSLAVRQDVDAISNKFLGSVPSGGTVATTTTSGTTATDGDGTSAASGS
jgi:flagellar basal-body rod modification protein FlgD